MPNDVEITLRFNATAKQAEAEIERLKNTIANVPDGAEGAAALDSAEASAQKLREALTALAGSLMQQSTELDKNAAGYEQEAATLQGMVEETYRYAGAVDAVRKAIEKRRAAGNGTPESGNKPPAAPPDDGGIAEKIEQLREMGRALSDTADNAAPYAEKLAKRINTLKDGVDALGTKTAKLNFNKIFNGADKSLAGLGDKLRKVLSVLGGNLETLDKIDEAFRNGTLSAEGAARVLAKMEDHLGKMSDKVSRFVERTENGFGLMETKAKALYRLEDQANKALERRAENEKKANEQRLKAIEAERLAKAKAYNEEQTRARKAEEARRKAAQEDAKRQRKAREDYAKMWSGLLDDKDKQEKQAREQDRIIYAMKLAAMSKRELIDESKRVAVALKEEARAGDVASAKYKELVIKQGQIQTALRHTRNQTALARMEFMQQAQMAAQLSGSLASLGSEFMNLGENAKNGTLNISGLTNSIFMMGMAIKSGMAPIGWAITALEALTLAWNWYAKSEKEAHDKALEMRRKNLEDLRDMEAATRRAMFDAPREAADKAAEAIRREGEAEKELLERRNAREEAAGNARVQMVRAEEEQKAEIRKQAALTEANDPAAEAAAKAASEKRIQQAEQEEARAARARVTEEKQADVEIAENSLKAADDYMGELRKKYGEMLDYELADNSELTILKNAVKQVEVAKDKEREQLEKQLDELNDQLGQFGQWERANIDKMLSLGMEEYGKQIEKRREVIAKLNGLDEKYAPQLKATEAERLASEKAYIAENSELVEKATEKLRMDGLDLEQKAERIRLMFNEVNAAEEKLRLAQQGVEDAKSALAAQAESNQLAEQAAEMDRKTLDLKQQTRQAEIDLAEAVAERADEWKKLKEMAPLEEQAEWLHDMLESGLLTAKEQEAYAEEMARNVEAARAARLEQLKAADNLKELAKWLAEQAADEKQTQADRKRWRTELATVEKQILERDKKAAEEARAGEWAQVQRTRSVAEQIKWLDRTVAGLEKGSDAAQKWGNTLAQLKDKQLAAAVEKVISETQTTGNYAEEDNRQRSEILKADAALLEARRAELTRLYNETDDFAEREKIADALKNTEGQLNGLNAQLSRAVAVAAASADDFKGPDTTAKKRYEKALAGLVSVYRQQLNRAQRALEQGDEAGYARAMEQLTKAAQRMQKVVEDPAAVDAWHTANAESKNIQHSAKEIARNQNRTADATRKEADAAKGAADGMNEAERSAKRAKQKADNVARKIGDEAAQQGQQATNAVNELAELRNQVRSMASSIDQLRSVCSELAAVCADTASATASATGDIRRAIGNINKSIDRIWRKIG